VGWIDSIRLYHNNHGKYPGWKVDWINVTQPSNGLSWRADFYRWLAKDEGDGQIDVTIDVPIPNVTLSPPIIKLVYLGYIPSSAKNDTNQPRPQTMKFVSSITTGISCGFSSATTVSGGVQLDATFLGVGTKFSLEVTQSTAKQLNSSEQQTTSFEVDQQITVPASSAMTAIEILYQVVLDGFEQVDGVNLSYEDKGPVITDTIWCLGWLTDSEVEEKVMETLQIAYGVQLTSLPQHDPQPIPLAEGKLSSIKAQDQQRALAKFPTLQSKAEEIEDRFKIHVLPHANKVIKISKNPSVFHGTAVLRPAA
jgi:hypothetical protein